MGLIEKEENTEAQTSGAPSFARSMAVHLMLLDGNIPHHADWWHLLCRQVVSPMWTGGVMVVLREAAAPLNGALSSL